ncbi:MAG: hypothetical protein LIO74_12485 [Ruminococcus sp.]|nr:hypothetical protein [Ruminococcus sp.]
MLPEENEKVVQCFLEKHPEFQLEPIAPRFGNLYCSTMLTLLPEQFHSDGFFLSKFRRKT